MVLAAALPIRADSAIRAIVAHAPLVKDIKKEVKEMITYISKLY